LAALLARAEEHKLIGWVAIFDGAFRQSAGEVDPAGKTQDWRIHEMNSHRRAVDEVREITGTLGRTRSSA
jgi:hypothetical protein